MAWTPRTAEILRAVAAYQLAQEALAGEFSARWAEALAAVEARESAGSLTELEVAYVTAIRESAAASRVLSIAFYRLVRALETGRVIGGPGYRPGTSLGSLWADFNRATGKRTGSGPREPLPVDTRDPFPADMAREARRAEETFRHQVADRVERHERERPAWEGSAALDDAELLAWEREFLKSLKTGSSGAGGMLVQDAGRDAIHAAIQGDPGAIGYYRKTDASPCCFCALMAGRGAVYKSERTAAFGPHPNCHCQPIPIFSRRYQLPAENDRFARMWRDFGGGSLADWRTYYSNTTKT
ncbi:VG15 protein [Kitasatospora sp. NPDC001574]